MIGHSGIGTHIRGLLEGWCEVAPDFRPTLLGDPAAMAHRVPDARRFPIVPFPASIYGVREQIGFPRRKTRGALLHCPHYNVALRHAGPLVVTLHDLIHLDDRWGLRSRLPRMYAKWMIRKAVERARCICAVSQATADALVGRFAVAADKIAVTHNAPSRAFLQSTGRPEEIERFQHEIDLTCDYLLTVGVYKPHKNMDFVFETLRALWKEANLKLVLVVAGVQEKERPALARRLAELGVADRVRVLDRLPGERLPLLYRGATALIHASLLEGFGLPIVEAQAVGTPVVASRASAVPEVAGEGALFFDPHDADDLARQVLAVVHNANLRDDLAAKGRRNAKRFSWRDTAEKVLSVYERVA